MTLQDLANYGEILGVAGVIASLVFVGWQIRSKTRSARLRMYEQVTQTYTSFLGSILVDPDVEWHQRFHVAEGLALPGGS